jgi:hypothetical protein
VKMLLDNDHIVPTLADETLSSTTTDGYESEKSSTTTTTTNFVIEIRRNGEEPSADPPQQLKEQDENISRLREIKFGYIRRQREKLDRLKMGAVTTGILATARSLFYQWRDSFASCAGDLCDNQLFLAAIAFLIGLLVGLVLGRCVGPSRQAVQFHGALIPFLPMRPKEVYF